MEGRKRKGVSDSYGGENNKNGGKKAGVDTVDRGREEGKFDGWVRWREEEQSGGNKDEVDAISGGREWQRCYYFFLFIFSFVSIVSFKFYKV